MLSTIQGALSGFAATVPMTAVMLAGHARLPRSERYPLPPRQIVEQAAYSTGLEHRTSASSKHRITWGAHFMYGAAVGALYAECEEHLPGGAVTKGAIYGLGVWAGSYLGLLPALRLLTPATQHPARRNALMIAAHLVWGGTLGAISKRIA